MKRARSHHLLRSDFSRYFKRVANWIATKFDTGFKQRFQIDDYVTYADSREISLYLQRPEPGLSSNEGNEHNDPLPALAFESQSNSQQQLNILRQVQTKNMELKPDHKH